MGFGIGFVPRLVDYCNDDTVFRLGFVSTLINLRTRRSHLGFDWLYKGTRMPQFIKLYFIKNTGRYWLRIRISGLLPPPFCTVISQECLRESAGRQRLHNDVAVSGAGAHSGKAHLHG